MPALEDMDQTDDVLLWEATGRDRYGETVRTVTPIPLSGRLVVKSRVVPGPDGRPMTIDGQLAVSRDVPLNSLVWEGKLKEWDPAATDVERLRVLEVVSLSGRARSIDGREVRHEYALQFFRGALPTGTEV